MITNVENLLTAEQLSDLVNAIKENKSYQFSKDGLTINSQFTDNGLQFHISYNSKDSEKLMIETTKNNFLNTLNSIDDDVFVSICESLDNSLLTKLQQLINSDKLDDVKYAIAKFTYEATRVIKEKIKLYKECLQKLEK